MKNNKIGFKTLVIDFLKAFNFEYGLIPTIRDLLIRPASVLNHYIESKQLINTYKEKYFFPARFFITTVAIIAFFSFFFGDSMLNPEHLESTTGYFDPGYQGELRSFISQYMILVVFFAAIVPGAIGTKIMFFKNKEYTFPMHLIMHVYLQSTVILSTPVFYLFISSQEQYMVVYMLLYIIYFTHALKNIFNISIFLSLFKTIFSQLISMLILLVITVLVVIILAIVKSW